MALDTSSHPGKSAKRPRPNDDDEIRPEQSASQIDTESGLLSKKSIVFSPPASRAPSRSPTREATTILRNASPPVLIEGVNGLPEPLPQQVDRLGRRLAEGFDVHFIPQGLKDTIKNDCDVGHQSTKPEDFDPSDEHSAEELSAIWEEVKNIFLNARECKVGARDENAWCNDVFQPLLSLAIKMQSQPIDPCYLSTVATRGFTDPVGRKAIDRKTDYVLSYSHRDPSTKALYQKLEAKKVDIGHTMDPFTKRTALFSGFELKPASGDQTEAEIQIAVWASGSIRIKQKLASLAQFPIEPAALVEPMFTVVGHNFHVYYCYPRDNLIEGNSGVHVLGPDVQFATASTSSVRTIFQLLKLMGNVLEYGMDEGDDGYWGIFGKILTRLAE